MRGRRQWAFIGRGRDREGEGEMEPEERSQTSTEERSVKVWNDGENLRKFMEALVLQRKRHFYELKES